MNYYQTEDFGFACYLKSSGVDLREVIMHDVTLNKCSFVFRIDEDSDELRRYKADWGHSDEARLMKRILFASKILKKELRNFLTSYYK
jgi:Domain of unknown function (DUF5659)